MIPAFVADASVAIGWIHPAQETTDTGAMLRDIEAGAVIEVPALWLVEVANALAVLVRRRKMTAAERDTALRWLRTLPVRVDHEGAMLAFSRLSELSSAHGLSVYDASYLELAQRKALPLACRDAAMLKAATLIGVNVWQREDDRAVKDERAAYVVQRVKPQLRAGARARRSA